MNRFNLETEELINLLMDKDTSAADKSMITQELHNHPNASEILEQYSQLQMLLDKAKPSLIPPPSDWTTSIIEQVKLISNNHFGFSWFGKLKYALIGLLFIIPMGLYFAYNNFNSNLTDNSSIQNNSIEQESEAKNITKSNIADEISSIQAITNKSITKRKNNNSNIALSSINQQTEIIATTLSPSPVIQNLDKHQNNNSISSTELNNTDFTYNTNNQIFSTRHHHSINESIVPLFSHEKIFMLRNGNSSPFNIIIQSRGNYALTSPEKNFVENDFFGSTYNLGIYIDVYENAYAGAEFGSEVFSQIFIDNNQPGAVYDQTPTLFYFGITGRYEFNQLSTGTFKPVGHLFVGGSSLGPLVRANAVIQANLIEKFGIFVGLEGGLLYYKNQNMWYNSGKLGLVGGINFKF